MAPPPPPSPSPSPWLSRLRRCKESPTGVKAKGASKPNGSGCNKQKPKRPICDRQTSRCTEVALYCWNRNRRRQGLSEYLVVKKLSSCAFTYSCEHMYHVNFTARPKYDPSAEPELFFAELKGNICKKTNHDVPVVCSLGPVSSVTAALNGCRACGSIPCPQPTIYHPEGGFCIGNPIYFLQPRSVLRTQSLPWKPDS